MKPIKKILGGLFILSGFVALLSLLHAQETAFQVQSVSLETKPDSIVQQRRKDWHKWRGRICRATEPSGW